MEREAMDRVDDERHARRLGGDAADDARLGGMRVDDVEFLLLEEFDEFLLGLQIVGRADLADKLRERDHAQPVGNPLFEEFPFRAWRRSRDKRDVMAFFKMTLARQKRVLLRAADNHPRDHMADFHGVLVGG